MIRRVTLNLHIASETILYMPRVVFIIRYFFVRIEAMESVPAVILYSLSLSLCSLYQATPGRKYLSHFAYYGTI